MKAAAQFADAAAAGVKAAADTGLDAAGTVAKGAVQVADTSVGAAGALAKGTVKVAQTGAHVAAGVTHVAAGMTTGAATLVAHGMADQIMLIKDSVVTRQQTPQELVDAPTPDDRWFQPARGWPEAVAPLPASLVPDAKEYKVPSWKAPPHLCPTAAVHTPSPAEPEALALSACPACSHGLWSALVCTGGTRSLCPPARGGRDGRAAGRGAPRDPPVRRPP